MAYPTAMANYSCKQSQKSGTPGSIGGDQARFRGGVCHERSGMSASNANVANQCSPM